jgi:hypothetical protein
MWRYDIIQKFINENKYKKYLEIGLGKECTNFEKIVNVNKIGVDPFWPEDIEKWLSPQTKIYKMTSNDFFKNKGSEILKNLDIAFIDGLHEYHQVIFEVQEILKYLLPTGTILIHDCLPFSEAMAKPLEEMSKYNACYEPWMGDVWKSIPILRAKFPEYSIFVIDSDCGIGVLTKQKMYLKKTGSFDEKMINDMTYEQFQISKRDMLNIVSLKEVGFDR